MANFKNDLVNAVTQQIPTVKKDYRTFIVKHQRFLEYPLEKAFEMSDKIVDNCLVEDYLEFAEFTGINSVKKIIYQFDLEEFYLTHSEQFLI